ncbi:Protein kinase [Sulfidibacter corallicola]|uniref:Protein kinase n=1 Tax=Sulfidibacter corallicola TaxID=2818388 RepID=A0A8A4TJW5_SULCO|nr:protein kinase [Sulfidibacter corallicola]QTD49840.1 protein kinase [Sulfidibacter corallicola]
MTERPADPGRPDPGWPDPDGLGSEPRPEHDALRLLHFVQARDPEALAQWMTAFGAVNGGAANASRAEAPVPEDARPQDAKPEARLEETPPADGFHSQAALGPGAVCGPFRIERKLGRGGMGNVYLATRSDDLDLQVALKTLHSWNPKMMSLFRKECKILSGLRHVNIAHLIDAGTLPSANSVVKKTATPSPRPANPKPPRHATAWGTPLHRVISP